MALVALGGGGSYTDPRYRQLLASQLIGQAIGGFGQARQQQGERQALGQLLAGKAGPGLGALTREGAPGLDPNLAGPSLGMTQGKMAQPGMLHTGQLTPQMAQAFMLQGGNPAALAALMPKPAETFTGKAGPGDVVIQGGKPLLSVPAEAKAPQTRDVLQGQERVFQQFDPATGQWSEVGRGPAFSPPTQINIGGPDKVPEGAVLPQAEGPRMVQNVADIAQAFMGPQGEINKTLLAQFNVPGMGGPVPGTGGARLRSAYDEAVQTLIYLKTGKAATDEERAAANAIYLPSPLDSPAEVTDKFRRLQQSIQSFLEVSGRGLGGASEVPPVPQIPEGQGQGILDQAMQWGGELLGLGGGAQASPPPGPPAAQPQPAQKPGPDATFEDLVNFYAGGGRF